MFKRYLFKVQLIYQNIFIIQYCILGAFIHKFGVDVSQNFKKISINSFDAIKNCYKRSKKYQNQVEAQPEEARNNSSNNQP
jgi:uncharacterized membrane protein